jgi:hypothetical protein
MRNVLIQSILASRRRKKEIPFSISLPYSTIAVTETLNQRLPFSHFEILSHLHIHCPLSRLVSRNPRAHIIGNQIRAMTPKRELRRRCREQRTSRWLWGEDSRFFFDLRGRLDVLGAELAGTGANCGGKDLLEALGGGDFFDGFEILFSLC